MCVCVCVCVCVAVSFNKVSILLVLVLKERPQKQIAIGPSLYIRFLLQHLCSCVGKMYFPMKQKPDSLFPYINISPGDTCCCRKRLLSSDSC